MRRKANVVVTEMSMHVMAYNPNLVISILGVANLINVDATGGVIGPFNCHFFVIEGVTLAPEGRQTALRSSNIQEFDGIALISLADWVADDKALFFNSLSAQESHSRQKLPCDCESQLIDFHAPSRMTASSNHA